MTQEEKAKAYDEAINRMRHYVVDEYGCSRIKVVDVFPELSESEDERIREELISFVRGMLACHDKPNAERDEKYESWIAWLEKQGEKPQGKSALEAAKEEKVDNQNCVKSTDKVEPKFKVGDWVVVNDGRIGRIIECTKDFADVDLGFSRLTTSVSNIRSWNVQDAKDGDVLVHSSFMFDDFIFIYNNTSILQAYCYYSNEANRFIIEDRGRHCPWNMQEVIPATKEQRDTLMKAMTDAGYTFDFEKKELKKIEQKPWSEEDERIYQSIMDDTVQENQLDDKQTDWLRNIKYRNFSQPHSQWKPSDKQIYSLDRALCSI